ncbi:MAG TPA: RDD family protein, partial [Thermodesulfovibrionales bacterium]|nr:RDD family protein [Thermodesulfovibrionales bacterium]
MSIEKTNTFTILTPEGIRFSLLLAGPVTRFLAWSVDFAVISAATGMIGVFLGLLRIISSDLAGAVTAIAFFSISIGYGIATEWFWKGQTLGKRLLNLRVMDVQGLRLHFSQIMIRNLLRFVDGLPVLYLVGGLACLLSAKDQRLGDIAANTIVIRNPKISDPDLSQLLAGKYNSF